MSHYNNIFNKKNVEYSLVEAADRLPYENGAKVTLNSKQIIFTSINNVLQRLLDNDLYNEALLKQYIDVGKIAGPITVDSIEEVLRQYDENRKFVLSNENGIQLVRKKLIPIEKTLKGRYLDGSKVNKVSFVDDRYAAVADTGYYVSENKIDWEKEVEKEGVAFVDVCYNKNYLINQNSLLSSFDWILIGNSSSGIELFGHYWLSDGSAWEDFSTNEDLSVFNINGKTGTHVFSFEDDSRLFVGTKNEGLWSIEGTPNVEPKRENGTNGWTINDFVEVTSENDYEKYFLATNYGIKQSRYTIGLSKLEKIKLFGKSTYVYKTIEKNGILYVATSSGLAKIENGSLSWLMSPDSVYDIIEYNRTIYAACGKKGIWKLNSTNPENTSPMSKVGTASALKFVVFHNDLFFLTACQNQKIRYIKHGNEQKSNIVENFNISGLAVRDLISTKNVLYVVTSNGIRCIKQQEAVNGFYKLDILSNGKITFSKNISNDRSVIQTDENKIYVINEINELLSKPGITCGEDLAIVDAVQGNGDDCYFLASDGTVYLLHEGIVEKVDGISDATKIEFVNGKLAFIDSSDETTKIYDGESIKRISTVGHFTDIGTNKTRLYGLEGNSVTPFASIIDYGLGLENANPTYDIENTAKYKEERIYENGEFSISADLYDVLASNVSAIVSSELEVFEKTAQNVKAVDFVGYAADKTLDNNPVLIVSDSGLCAFSIQDPTKAPVEMTSFSPDGFADWRVYSQNERNVLSLGSNFAFKDSTLYQKNLVSLFFEEKDVSGIEKALVENDALYFTSGNNLIKYNKKENSIDNCVVLESQNQINNIVRIDNDILVCGSGQEAINVLALEGDNNDYFPGSIQPYFLPGNIEFDSMLSDLVPELSDNSTSIYINLGGYDLSVYDFAKFSNSKVTVISGDSLSGNSQSDALLKNLIPLQNSTPTVLELSNVRYLYSDNGLKAEDFNGRGYSVTIGTNSISFSPLVDYIKVELSSIEIDYTIDGNIPVYYGNQVLWKKYSYVSENIPLDALSVCSVDVELTSNEFFGLDLIKESYEITSDVGFYSVKTNGFVDLSILLSSNEDTTLSIESYISYYSNSAVSSYTKTESSQYLADGLSSFDYKIPFGYQNIDGNTDVSVLTRILLSNDTQTTVSAFISSNCSIDGKITNEQAVNVPNLLQKNNEPWHYGDSSGLYSYFCKIPGDNDDYLMFLQTDDDAPQFCKINESDINEEFVSEDYGFIYLKNTDLSINSQVTETIDGYQVKYNKVFDCKNDSFNDVLYYSLDGIDRNLYVPAFSNKSTTLTAFLSSDSNGHINGIKAVGNHLYVATDSGLKFITKNDFDSVGSVSGITSKIIKLEADETNLYALDDSQKLFIVSSGTNDRTLTSVKDIFSSNGKTYCLSGNALIQANDRSVVLTSDQFSNLDSCSALFDSDYYFSPSIVTNGKIYYSKLGYDFSTNYDTVKTFSDETIVDAKTLLLEDQNVLFVGTEDKIYYEALPLTSYSFSNAITGFNGIKAFGFTTLSNLVVLDNDGLEYYTESLTSIESLENLSEKSLNLDYAGLTSTYKMVQREPFYVDPQPLIIEYSSDGAKYLVLSNVISFKEDPSKTRTFDKNLSGFLRYDDSNLYLLAGDDLYYLENNIGENVWKTKLSSAYMNPKVFAIQSDSNYWTLSSSNLPLQIIDSTLSCYPIDLSGTNGVFKLGNKIYYYSTTENGIYAKDSVYSYVSSTNEIVESTVGKNVYALDFLDSENYVYNYVSAITAEASAYSGSSADNWTINATVSLFDSTDSDLCSRVNLEYDSLEGMQMIKNYKNYVFFSNGGNAYVYNKKLKNGFSITFEDLANMNDGSSKLLAFDNGYLGYGNLLARFDDFGRTFEFGTPLKKYSILANTFRVATNDIEIVNEVPDFLVGSNFGLRYVYDNLLTRSFYEKNDRANSLNRNVTVVKQVNVSDGYYYIVAQNNELYEVTGLKIPKFKKILTLSSDETVTSIFPFQKDEYLIATTKGLYTTDHKFTIHDDLHSITLSSVYGIINEELAKILKAHVEKDHNENSFITQLNKKADTKLTFLSPADKQVEVTNSEMADGVKIIENDIIDTIERGGEDSAKDTYVKVAVSNWATKAIKTEATYSDGGFVSKFIDPTTGKEFDISTVPYVVKNWKSGLKEIYVYVPTTATYYLNNPQGISNSQYSYNSTQRKNVPSVSMTNTLPAGATMLRVYLYNSHFGIRTILAAQCFGNSLPLKIYKDNVNADDSWKGFFDTVVQPSTLKTLPMSNDKSVNNARVCTDDQGRIVLDFAVYGTDAQAIRIIAEA